jgi:hypothetical protein
VVRDHDLEVDIRDAARHGRSHLADEFDQFGHR